MNTANTVPSTRPRKTTTTTVTIARNVAAITVIAPITSSCAAFTAAILLPPRTTNKTGSFFCTFCKIAAGECVTCKKGEMQNGKRPRASMALLPVLQGGRRMHLL